MSDLPTNFRSLARMGWGGKAASHFRNLVQCDNQNVTGRTVINRGQIGTVFYRSPGVTVNKALTGITRDNTGTAIGNCTVDLFETGSDILKLSVISDSGGNFVFGNPGTGPFYLVAYKVGSPDISGTTVNTLTAV